MLGFIALLGIFSETEVADLEQPCGDVAPSAATGMHYSTLIKKKIKFSAYIMKFKMEQLRSHI